MKQFFEFGTDGTAEKQTFNSTELVLKFGENFLLLFCCPNVPIYFLKQFFEIYNREREK
jgi:hypothetical protein